MTESVKSDLVGDAFSGILGTTTDNPVAKKLSEIKKVLDQEGIEPTTKKWITETIKSVLESIPVIFEAKSTKNAVFEQDIATIKTQLAEITAIKSALEETKKAIETMAVDVKVAKGITETLKNAIPASGKSLNEQSNENAGRKLEELPPATQDDLFFAKLKEVSLAQVMSGGSQ